MIYNSRNTIQKEKDIQKDIIKYLNSLNNVYYVRVTHSSKNGVPDLILCINGNFIAIEIKRLNGKVSQLQKLNIDKIKQANGKAYIVYTLQEVKDIVTRYNTI